MSKKRREVPPVTPVTPVTPVAPKPTKRAPTPDELAVFASSLATASGTRYNLETEADCEKVLGLWYAIAERKRPDPKKSPEVLWGELDAALTKLSTAGKLTQSKKDNVYRALGLPLPAPTEYRAFKAQIASMPLPAEKQLEAALKEAK